MRTDIYHHIVLDPETQAKAQAILDKFELLLDQMTADEEADRAEIVRLTTIIDTQAQKLQGAMPAIPANPPA